jgi:hypothetical protein
MFFKYSEPLKQIIAIWPAYLVKFFGFVFKTENSRPVAESRPVCVGLNPYAKIMRLFRFLQGCFQGFFRAVKRPQKLNLELSFETQSSHQSFSAVKIVH